MLNLRYAKPKEKLLNAPLDIQYAMKDFVDCSNAENALRADIIERFNYPLLWTAIDKLLKHREEVTIASIELKAAGYTSDDAYMFYEYGKTINSSV